MRPLRPIPVHAAAAAGITALAALALLTAGPVTAGAATTQSAQSEYRAALNAVGAQGVHFVSLGSQKGVAIDVTGDTGTTSGAQTLVVKNGKLTEHMSALVVGSSGYVNGNATALHQVIGLTNAQSSKYAGTWLSFPISNNGLAELVSGLLDSQVTSELQVVGPYSYGTATTVAGKHALAVRGFQSTQSGSKVPTILYVSAAGSPLPIEEVTNPNGSGGSSVISGTVTFSHWGENKTQQAPAHSVSLLKLIPASASSATTAG